MTTTKRTNTVLIAALVVTHFASCGGRPVDGPAKDAALNDADSCAGLVLALPPARCFRRCRADADCVRVPSSCCCAAAVNRAFRQLFEQIVRECDEQRIVDGEDCDCWAGWDCVRQVACVEGACGETIECAHP